MEFLFLIFCVATFYQILTSKFKVDKKLLRALVVLFAPDIGIILYFIIGKSAKVTEDDYPSKKAFLKMF
ncbi:hypothetical protein [Salinimicrobium sp. TH3]|uniref:hypothetical protein n=1 Tax=Salinimicrobium sp. TH3 TaxID=2997342 RepID=UPI00227348DB|nr:hypothetical protein [Salinimicrobium sp. TH3]MCY2687468.1 hypothetical protein [Salinimicrobium sp. TH3]